MFALIPIHRPEFHAGIASQIAAMGIDGNRVIVVSDGFDRPLEPLIVGAHYHHRPTKRGIGAARNECVRIARAIDPDDSAQFLDADDHYWPWFWSKCAAVAAHFPEYSGWGQAEFWQRNLLTGEDVLLGAGTANQQSHRGMAGGTLGFRLRDCVPFVETLQTGEDTAWCRDMREAGHALWSMSNDHYLKLYRGPNAGHTHPVAAPDLDSAGALVVESTS